MNIPNDGGWGKPDGLQEKFREQASSGLAGHFLALPGKWVLLTCLVLTGTLCFGIGLMAARENRPSGDSLWIEQLPASELPGSLGAGTTSTSSTSPPTQVIAPATQSAAAAAALPQTGQYVASKTGSKYYLPSCGTAKRIKDENKVWFATKAAAETAGYQPAANCKGL